MFPTTFSEDAAAGKSLRAQQHQRSAVGAGAGAPLLDVAATPTTSEAAIVNDTIRTLIARM